MKKQKIAASVLVVGGLLSPLAHATNGDEMMAVGSQSTAMGGTGVANYVGAESLWANPAMLGKSKGSEVTGGVNLFKPKVANNGMAGGTAKGDSTADTSYIPDLSYASRFSDNLSYGLALAGIAGMGVDYTGASPSLLLIKAKSELSILRVVADIAYNNDNYGFGFAPIFQSGSLMLSYDSTAIGGGPNNSAQNKNSSTGFGYALGGYYNPTSAVTVAAAYQSKIAGKYGTQISDAGKGFGLMVGGFGAPFGDDLDQPAQMKLGVAFAATEAVTVTADYKRIQWGSAAGYKDFNWKDQNIVAIGAKYAGNGYWVGLGYNHANDPIEAAPDTTYRNAAINMFNNLFFPAVVTNSYTLGGGYDFSKSLAIEGAYVMTPEVTKTVSISSLGGASSNTTTHSQQALEVSLRYKF